MILKAEEIKTKLKEVFKDKDFYPKHYVWEEDGVKYSAWEISPGTMTGDGGMETYSKMLAEEAAKFKYDWRKPIPLEYMIPYDSL